MISALHQMLKWVPAHLMWGQKTMGEPEKRVWITVAQCVLKTGQGDGVIF